MTLHLSLHSISPSPADYFVIRLDRKDGLQSPEDRQASPLVKQVQWFEDRLSTIMDVTFDPKGEWLACVTLSGAVHLIPVAPTMIVSEFIAMMVIGFIAMSWGLTCQAKLTLILIVCKQSSALYYKEVFVSFPWYRENPQCSSLDHWMMLKLLSPGRKSVSL